MKFISGSKELDGAIKSVARVIPSKSANPALTNVMLRADSDGYVTLTGYNLERAVTTRIKAEVKEAGSILAEAKMFGAIISSLAGPEVSVSTVGMSITVKSNDSNFSVVGMNADSYPSLPDADDAESIKISTNVLSGLIHQTVFAVSANMTRPIYTGELFEISGGTLTLVATDGYRLAIRQEKLDDIESVLQFVVPGAALVDFEKLATQNADDSVTAIVLTEKHISFNLGDTRLVTRRLDGTFLDYRTALPKESSVRVSVNRSDFEQCLKRVSLLASGDKIPVPAVFTFDDGNIKIHCQSSMGKVEDTCGSDADGHGLKIGLNCKYMLDALKAIPDEEVMLCLSSSSSPCVLKPISMEDTFTHMVLPIQLKADD